MPADQVVTRAAPKPGGIGFRNADERAFLPAALEIVETPASPAGRATVWVIIGAVVFALAWACIGKLDIIATAPGHIVPLGKTKTIQPVETEVVKTIYVSDGDHVRAGDLLIAFDPVQAEADRDHYLHNLRQARLDQARLQGLQAALAAAASPELMNPPADATPIELETARAAMVSQASEQAAKLAALDDQIAQKSAEAGEASAEITKIQQSLPLVEQQADIRRKLKEMQFGNKLAYLEAEQRRVEQADEVPVLLRHREQAEAAKLALLRQRDETVAEYEKTVLGDLAKTTEQVNELQAELTKSAERLAEQTLHSPIDGSVQQLAVHTIGGVVTPAEPLMVIVPDRDGLLVEATVSNRDVGFVHPGQRAEIKVETFNFTRYGFIDGTVDSLSRDVVTEPSTPRTRQTPDMRGEQPGDEAAPEPGYTARITLSRNWIETESGRMPLGPGMSVTAEIHTGRRRIIDYLLSPLVRHVSESLHER